MVQQNGNISVHTENILPIIKKWLYSDKDIFLRELVSNGCDAINKLKQLISIGEADISSDEKFQMKVVLDKGKKTIQVIDNGIGMTEEEVIKYITQIAFSGAEEFVAKYKEKGGEGSQIIGHFGLGFYSAFMVSERVEIDTQSYLKDAPAVKWVCWGGSEYKMEASDRQERGTTVTLYIAEDSEEFLDAFKLKEVLEKYCSFMPVEIYFEEAGTKDKKDEEAKPINDIHPLWLKAPRECTDEEYKAFYKKVFRDFDDPLFWIHLNVDYPFNLKGILYFPKLRHEFDAIEGQIKLFSNQVFVADNIKEVIPEFLLLLKGTLDCPDLPLNVSRSFLQNDGYVKKISAHITRKVADKLISLFKEERENYNRYWDDINPFIKFGCMKDAKFYERVKDIIIYKTTQGDYVTLKDYLERNKDKHVNKVFYVNDEEQQAQYIHLFKEHNLEAVILPSAIDSHFIQFLEIHEKGVKFNRIDSDLSETLKDNGKKEEDTDDDVNREDISNMFKEALEKESLKIQVERLKVTQLPGMILLSEQSRRMQEMSKFLGGIDKNMFPEEFTLVINAGNPLINLLMRLKKQGGKEEDIKMICQQVYDLAMISHKQLDAEDMTQFIERSNTILTRLLEKEVTN